MSWKQRVSPQAPRLVGRSDRRDRHRDRSSASSPDRYVHIAAQRHGRRSRVPNERTQHRAWHSELARPPLRRGQVRHHTESRRAVLVGDPAHRERTRRDAAVLNRPLEVVRRINMLADAAEEGLMPAQPGGASATAENPPKPVKVKDIQACEAAEVARFIDAIHRDSRNILGTQLFTARRNRPGLSSTRAVGDDVSGPAACRRRGARRTRASRLRSHRCRLRAARLTTSSR